MRPHLYQVLDDDTDDCFGLADDFETALGIARSAAREGRVGATVLLIHKGFAIRHLVLMPDGQVAEEEITVP